MKNAATPNAPQPTQPRNLETEAKQEAEDLTTKVSRAALHEAMQPSPSLDLHFIANRPRPNSKLYTNLQH